MHRRNRSLYRPQGRGFLRVAAVMALAWTVQAYGQDASDDENVENERLELLQRWESAGLVKPADVEAMAKQILEKPLSEQTVEDLKHLAKQSNAAANFVGHILDEYEDYHRDNYRYDFVLEKVAPFRNAYVELSNRLKSYRNEAYFNLGIKAMEGGDDIEAFLYFRDSYRLSLFTEGKDNREGMRYKSEIQMKKLLGIEELGTFVHWSGGR